MGKLSNCGHDERNKYSGGVAGDQKGDEWAIIDWYSRPWTECYYHPDQRVNDLMADLAIEAAQNNNCGYDQGQRLTFWKQLVEVGYRPTDIKKVCEADCSSGVLALAKAVGYILGIDALKNINESGYTGNEGSILKRAGYVVTKEKKYLTSDASLKRGYILNYPGHHTATYVGNGKKQSDSTSAVPESVVISQANGKVAQGQKWFNVNYGTTLIIYKGEKLVEDDEYGNKSRSAALCIWKDVVNRKYGYNLTPSNENFLYGCKEAAIDAQIYMGKSGTLVYILQFILAAKGFYAGKLDADFGSGTDAAVRAFQDSRGLVVDGIVGPDTWFELFN